MLESQYDRVLPWRQRWMALVGGTLKLRTRIVVTPEGVVEHDSALIECDWPWRQS